MGSMEEWLDKRLGREEFCSPPRPMLAGDLDGSFAQVKWPKLASAKIDGYRCLIWNRKAWTRSGKLHPCRALQAWAEQIPWNLDGELIVPGEDFATGGGKLRRADYQGPWLYLVFDLLQDGLNAQERYTWLRQIEKEFPPSFQLLPQIWLEDTKSAEALESEVLQVGFEGLCLRDPWAKYKHGRGTLKDQALLKLKRFKTAEAKVLGVEPRMHNLNEAELSPLGYTERSTAKEGLVETQVLGKLHCLGLNGPFQGREFSIGTFDGLSDWDKTELLANPPVGQICTFKYFPQGLKDKPRHPVWLCWRPDWDLEGEKNDQQS